MIFLYGVIDYYIVVFIFFFFAIIIIIIITDKFTANYLLYKFVQQ